MKSGIEELEELKNVLHRRLQHLLALTEKGSPARVAAEEAKVLWDQISALEATLDVFGDPELRRDIEEGLREIAVGDVTPWGSVLEKHFTPEGRSKKRDV